MNKWWIVGVVALLVLGIIVGVYVFQGSEGEQGSQGTGETKTADIPSDSALKLFDALEQGLNR